MNAAELVDDILEHHGVKGMHWGVRQGRNSEGFTRKDARWVKKTHGANLARGHMYGKTTRNIINDAQKGMKPEIKALNKKPEFNTKEAKKSIKKGTNEQYHKAVADIYMKHVKAAAPKHLQISPSGEWKDELKIGKDSWYVATVRTDKAQHASISNPDFAVWLRPIRDEEGYIVDFELLPPGGFMAQSAINDILEHHGIKGMKWGVRRDRSSSVSVSEKGKKLKTSGGHGLPAHSDAVRARTIGQIAKKSGVKSLSDSELRTYQQRLNLEHSVKRLQYKEKNAAQRFVAKTLGQAGSQQADKAANAGAAKLGAKALAIAAAA